MSKSTVKRASVKLALEARHLRRLPSAARITARLNAPPKVLKPERIAQLKKLGKL